MSRNKRVGRVGAELRNDSLPDIIRSLVLVVIRHRLVFLMRHFVDMGKLTKDYSLLP